MISNDEGWDTARHYAQPSRRAIIAGAATASIAAGIPSAATSQQIGAAAFSGAVNLTVNGTRHALTLDPRTTVLDMLREHLDLTGTKKGCDQGQCGACTVLIDGRRINSCLTFALMYDSAQITTIEGLAKDGALHPLQQAFIDHDALQCGYCTPGQICSGVGLIAEGKARTAEEIRELMSGNICRCGAYTSIVAAIQQAMGQS
jgi:xanthine dehydrogenase YagT iron-sulfur-binding subunit